MKRRVALLRPPPYYNYSRLNRCRLLSFLLASRAGSYCDDSYSPSLGPESPEVTVTETGPAGPL